MARADVNYINKSTKQMLKEHKNRIGDVVLVKISERTTIELPAALSQEEKNARIEQYKKTHSAKM